MKYAYINGVFGYPLHYDRGVMNTALNFWHLIQTSQTYAKSKYFIRATGTHDMPF